MSSIKVFPKTPIKGNLPLRIKRPCDFGLEGAINDLETQLGTIEAYNRLAEAAQRLKARIERGSIKSQNPIYAASIKGEAPNGGVHRARNCRRER